MTINEILTSDKPMLTAYDIADILGSDAATIRVTAQTDPEALGPLQPIRIGNRVKFPRPRFVAWYTGNNADQGGQPHGC